MSKKITSYKAFNDQKSQNYLAACYPKGKLTAKRFDGGSIVYKLILCLSTFIKVFTGQLFEFVKNRDIDQALELLPEWETSVKIPERYPQLDTLTKRRDAVKRRISKVPVYNVQDIRTIDDYTSFEEYIRLMTGIEVEIEVGIYRDNSSSFSLSFPIIFDYAVAWQPFIFYIKVPVETSTENIDFSIPFPVEFYDAFITDTTKALLDKALDDVLPSFCAWIYEPLE